MASRSSSFLPFASHNTKKMMMFDGIRSQIWFTKTKGGMTFRPQISKRNTMRIRASFKEERKHVSVKGDDVEINTYKKEYSPPRRAFRGAKKTDTEEDAAEAEFRDAEKKEKDAKFREMIKTKCYVALIALLFSPDFLKLVGQLVNFMLTKKV